MPQSQHFTQAYILHTRAYRETSLIVELFTQAHGRVAAVAKGAKQTGKRKTGKMGSLQAFIPIHVALVGKQELMTLRQVESSAAAYHLQGKLLFSGLYLNELLMRVLPRCDAHPQLFQAYAHSIIALSTTTEPEPILRCFELQLLEALGYALAFTSHGTAIEPDAYYLYQTENGFSHIQSIQSLKQQQRLFLGKHLLAIAQRDFNQAETLKAVKRLLRSALSPLLGHKPLASRKLFVGCFRD